jgi:hypothetical protein
MKFTACLLLMLAATVPVWAKPKIDVKVKVFNGVGRDRVADSLSKSDKTSSNTNESMLYERVFYFNVTLTSDRAEPVLAKNNGNGASLATPNWIPATSMTPRSMETIWTSKSPPSMEKRRNIATW